MKTEGRATKRRRRIVTIVLGAAGIGVLLLSLVFSKEFFVVYYVDRMESDAGFLNELTGDLEDSTKHEAFQRFVKRPEAVPLLIDALLAQPWDPFENEEAPPIANALVVLGPSAVSELQAFLETCDLTTYQGEDKILKVLELIGTKAKSTTPIVSQQLKHDYWELRELAVSTLGEFGKESEAARAVLRAAVKEKTDVRGDAWEALKKLGEKWPE